MSERKRLRWTVASARQNLPTLIGLAAREPQEVYRRNTLVAKVVAPDTETARPGPRPLAEALAELQQICAEERYSLSASKRSDRSNPFARSRKR